MRAKHWTQTAAGRVKMAKIAKRQHAVNSNSTDSAHRTLAKIADVVTRLESENRALRRQLEAVDRALARGRS